MQSRADAMPQVYTGTKNEKETRRTRIENGTEAHDADDWRSRVHSNI